MLSLPDFKEKHIIVVFAKEGEKINIQNDNLIVKNSAGEIILQFSCYRMLGLWIVGSCTLSSGIMERSKKFGFPVLLLNYNFRLTGNWNAAVEGNFLLRQKQYEYNGMDISKRLVKNKITNQLMLLNAIRKKDENTQDAIKSLKQYQAQIDGAEDLKTVLGIEGIASRVFFSCWYSEMSWKGRKPRAKHDIINVLLDIGYTYLFYFIEIMLNLYGFDLYKGVYHQLFYQRKSLVCDIVEPFRCIIDKKIKKAFNLKQVKQHDFILKHDKYQLAYGKNKEYTKWLLDSILEYKNEIFLYCQSYYRAFISGKDIKHFPFFELDKTK